MTRTQVLTAVVAVAVAAAAVVAGIALHKPEPVISAALAQRQADPHKGAYIAAAGLPLPVVGYAIALVAEVGGGLLLLLGYQTRYAALGLAVFTVAAAIGFHHNFADQNQMIHFLKNLAITGGLLQIFAFGPGSFSLDARAAKG